MSSANQLIQEARNHRREGKAEAAESAYHRAAEVAGPDEAGLRAHALRHAAELAIERGAEADALEAAQDALKTYLSLAEAPMLDVANAFRVRALAWASVGRAKKAAQDWQEARDIYERLGISAGVAECDARLSSA
jgi:tetratricopeptide (TPR) repeat protein